MLYFLSSLSLLPSINRPACTHTSIKNTHNIFILYINTSVLQSNSLGNIVLLLKCVICTCTTKPTVWPCSPPGEPRIPGMSCTSQTSHLEKHRGVEEVTQAMVLLICNILGNMVPAPTAGSQVEVPEQEKQKPEQCWLFGSGVFGFFSFLLPQFKRRKVRHLKKV